jgi:hypothetical protein
MSRGIKIGIIVAAVVIVLPVFGIAALFVGISLFDRGMSAVATRQITVANHASLIIDGARNSRSEHGFSQRAGYRPAESANIEWFGELSDGVDPQIYQTGSLVVVIDVPAAELYVRRPDAKWATIALIFPNDLGPSFPISFYAEKSGLTTEEVSRIDEVGGKRGQKWPTTYIQSFDPKTRNLKCEYHLDNKSWWPLHLRLSEDGAHLNLIAIGESSP